MEEQLKQRTFLATVWITIDEEEAGMKVNKEHIAEYLADALDLTVNTEDYGNPVGFCGIEINWDELKEVES